MKYQRFEYECRNNTYEAANCYSKNDDRVFDLNVRFEEDGFMIECRKLDGGGEEIVAVGCVVGGKFFAPGQKIASLSGKPFVSICEKTDYGLRKRPYGCLGDKKSVALNDQLIIYEKQIYRLVEYTYKFAGYGTYCLATNPKNINMHLFSTVCNRWRTTSNGPNANLTVFHDRFINNKQYYTDEENRQHLIIF
uniref:Abnormal cell migration protein 18-like fibronectin type I domain-containing protein n=1 Tax=Romanomermis culicivorax TaxID=13658 RepID=A0A915KZC6_ROMCU